MAPDSHEASGPPVALTPAPESGPTGGPSRRRRGSIRLLLAFLLIAIPAVLMRRQAISLLVPLAGPTAGRMYGHRCGMVDQAPILAAALGLALVLAGAAHLRWHRKTTEILLWIAYVPWGLTGLISEINTLE
ncbi:MAG: hypothetical protein R3F17_02820 [Planctomycetota bacterium]